jgi:hypothetical protein
MTDRETAFQKLVELLVSRGYNRTLSGRRIVGDADSPYRALLDIWVDGKVVLVQRIYEDDVLSAFEVFVPVTSSIRVSDTLDALRNYIDTP